MARVTVEDCLEHVEDRFSLVHLATQRAKQLKKGVNALVICDNREVVTALREIAEGLVSKSDIVAPETDAGNSDNGSGSTGSATGNSDASDEKVKEASHG